MAWTESVPYSSAVGRLKAAYDRVRSGTGQIDNILSVHSLRPHTLEGHMTLYKSVLHHSGNSLPLWLLEALGVRVSLLNGCSYCVKHHLAGLRASVSQTARVDLIQIALETGAFEPVFDVRCAALLRYADKLTSAPSSLIEDDLAELRAAGLNDGEILEANQVVSYFAYANRTVLGLGVTTDGEAHIGLSPRHSDQADDWRHE